LFNRFVGKPNIAPPAKHCWHWLCASLYHYVCSPLYEVCLMFALYCRDFRNVDIAELSDEVAELKSNLYRLKSEVVCHYSFSHAPIA